MGSRFSIGVVATIAGALLACAPAVDAEREAESSAPVVRGLDAPYEHVEVGRFADCTGTLVAADVVLSAAHCFDYASGERSVGDFVLDLPSGARAFPTAEVEIFGDTTGPRDLALVRLAERVPPSVARPARIAVAAPSRGETVTLWGYGCTARPEPIQPTYPGGAIASGAARTKRRAAFAWDEHSMHACPGDSGGPVLDGFGAIVAVASAYISIPVEEGGGGDVFADPVGLRGELLA